MHQDKKITKGSGVMRGLGAALPMTDSHKPEWYMRGIYAALAVLGPSIAAAQDAAEAAPVPDKGDTAWMLVSTLLVIMMAVPGLALFYGGMVRAKNVLSVAMQVFVIFSLLTVLWVIYGYSLAFNGPGAWIGDFSRLFLSGITADTNAATFTEGVVIPEYVFVAFQATFAAITTALAVGAFAERTKFSAVLIFAVIWFTFSYLPIARMVWFGEGYLFKLGALDYAGGTVVHINAGIAGLVACLVLGKRKGFPTTPMAPHNLGYTLMGAAMLWVGWFGFNAGSAVAANGTAGMAMLVTQIATAAAALGWMFAEWITHGKPSALGIASGVVAGLVAITPAAGTVGPMGALVIGLAAGVVCFFCATTLKRKLGYDDSLDAFGVHGIGGILGAILTGVFAAPALGGFGTVTDIGAQVWIQFKGVAFTVVYTAIVTFVILKVLDAVMGLRVSEEEEAVGLDLAQHNERGYNL
jgi:Amt family ammonium transporter